MPFDGRPDRSDAQGAAGEVTWLDREDEIRRVMSLGDGVAGIAVADVDSDARRLGFFVALWMHQHGFTSLEYAALQDEFVTQSGTSVVAADRIEHWVMQWRSGRLPPPLHGVALDSLIESAAALHLWSGGTLPAKDADLPPQLGATLQVAAIAVSASSEVSAAVVAYEQCGQIQPVDRRVGRLVGFRHFAGLRGLLRLSDGSGSGVDRQLSRALLFIETADLRDDDLAVELAEAVLNSQRLVKFPYVTRDAWAEPGERAPSHFAERLRTGGIHNLRYATGGLVCLGAYAPHDHAALLLRRFCREPTAIGIERKGSDVFQLDLVLERALDGVIALVPFSFNVGSVSERADVARLIVQRSARLEVYDAVGGELLCLETGVVHIPDEAVTVLSEYLEPWRPAICTYDTLLGETLGYASDDRPYRLDASERARFELLWDLSHHAQRSHLTADQRAELATAIEAYLLGSSHDQADPTWLASLRSDMMTALRLERPPPRARATELVADGLLASPGRWLMYADVREMLTGLYLDLVACGVGPDGSLLFERIDRPVEETFATLLATLEHAVVAGHDTWERREQLLGIVTQFLDGILDELADALAAHGATHVVVCPGFGVESIPFHAVPGWVGRFDVTYTPSAALLQLAIPDLLPPGVDVHRGATDGAPLDLVDRELSAVAGAYDVADFDANLLRPRHALVHFSGHANTGPSLAARRLRASHRDVTVGELLAHGDYVGVRVVTLSACASGAFIEGNCGPQELGGLDFALIALGARSVVATAWEVHDTAAALFMTVFHAGLGKHGEISRAFNDARNSIRNGFGGTLDQFAERLDECWPTWRADVTADDILGRVVHWGAFRIAGRTW